MFFVEKSLLMRIGYNLDINAQDKPSFIDHNKPTLTFTREENIQA